MKIGALIRLRGESPLRSLFAVFITVAWLLPAGVPLYAFFPAPYSVSRASAPATQFSKRKKTPPQYCRAEEGSRISRKLLFAPIPHDLAYLKSAAPGITAQEPRFSIKLIFV